MAFVEDWDAMLAATGVHNADLAYYLAQIPFESTTDRDEFIAELTA